MKKIILSVIFAGLGVIALSCGGSDESSYDYVTSVVGDGDESGKLNVSLSTTVSSAVTADAAADQTEISAILELAGGTSELTGTLDTATNEVVLTGGIYNFTGTASADGKLYGSYTNASGDGVFAGFNSQANTVEVYCGTYDSDNCTDDNCSGIWDITTSSVGLSSGTYLGNGGASGILWGTISGNTLAGEDDEGSILTGTVANGVVTGTWEIDGTTGTFEGSIAACP